MRTYLSPIPMASYDQQSMPMDITPKHSASISNDLSARMEKIAPALQGLVQKYHLAGMAVSVISGEDSLWSQGFGLRDIHENAPVTPHTPFMLASVSKTASATATAIQLQKSGGSWDQPVNEIIDFKVNHPQYTNDQMTLRQLATHTSSIQDRDDLWTHPKEDDSLYTQGDATAKLGDILKSYLVPGGKLYNSEENFLPDRPGTSYSYSNISIDLLGYAIEKQSGQQFEDLCQEILFRPLGMNHTAWRFSEHDLTQVAMPYEYFGGEFHSCGHYGYPDRPCGHLISSAHDLALYMSDVAKGYQGRGSKVLSQESIQKLLDSDRNEVDYSQAQGWHWDLKNDEWYVGHNGSDYGVCTAMWLDPVTGKGFTVLLNTSSWEADQAREEACDMITKALS